jgi:hypothetical protein
MKLINAIILALLCGLAPGWCLALESTTGDAGQQQSVEPLSQSDPSADSMSANPMIASQLLTLDGDLDIGKALTNVPFKVNYPSFGPGHKVTLRWVGAAIFTSVAQTTAATGPLTFYVPKTTIAASFGDTASVSYTVEIPGMAAITSDPLNVKVKLGELPPPSLAIAPDGKVDIGKAALQIPVTVVFPSLAAGEKITLNWQGSSVYKTAAQTTASTAALTFSIPREIIARDLGNSGSLTYTVEIPGVPPQTSAPLNLQIEFGAFPPPRFPLSTGVDSARLLNSLYADTPARCDNDTPAYYCSGVFLRGVADGSFDPWNPSPSAIKLGAQSFSFARSDANMKQTFVASGYILNSPDDAIKQGKPVHFLCIYPYNAGTSGMTPLGKGCDAEAKVAPPPNDDLSTCTSKQATTVESWLAYTKTKPQCSLSMQDPAQFMTMLGVRAASPGNTAHNEVMVEAWAQDVAPKLPLAGFFYNTQAGLSAAKSFQNKFKTRTGEWLPVLRLDLNQPSPFTYDSTDQWTLP